MRKVISEGNRLQKVNVAGNQTTTNKFTQTQLIAAIVSAIILFIIPQGFSDNFAGFIISFLGIFIGLFTGIAISMHDRSREMLIIDETTEAVEKARIIKVTNYLVQFTGLTAYGILLSLVVIFMLSLVLLSPKLQTDLRHYNIVSDLSVISNASIINFFIVVLLLAHRFFTLYFLLNFLAITTYSISSYFSFLMSDYSRIRIKRHHEM